MSSTQTRRARAAPPCRASSGASSPSLPHPFCLGVPRRSDRKRRTPSCSSLPRLALPRRRILADRTAPHRDLVATRRASAALPARRRSLKLHLRSVAPGSPNRPGAARATRHSLEEPLSRTADGAALALALDRWASRGPLDGENYHHRSSEPLPTSPCPTCGGGEDGTRAPASSPEPAGPVPPRPLPLALAPSSWSSEGSEPRLARRAIPCVWRSRFVTGQNSRATPRQRCSSAPPDPFLGLGSGQFSSVGDFWEG
eukprot:scaffold127357_cov23-Tisochrysis_lutea.AAC.2